MGIILGRIEFVLARDALPRPTRLLKFKLGHYGFLPWGKDHFDRISKPCPVKILVAACEVK